MRKHIILFFSALLFLYACNKAKAPAGTLNENVITRLLVDVHIIDGSLAVQPVADSLYKYGTGRYLQLFKQYHTDSTQFKKSMRYYTSQPDQLLKVYDNVAKILQKKSDSLTNIQEKINAKERLQQLKLAKEAAKVIAAKKDSLKKDSVKKAAIKSKSKLKGNKIKNALPQ